MIEVPFEKIAACDVQKLIEDSVAEGKTLEFKEELPSGRDEDKREFLADVSSFANASGGDLLFGITAERDDRGKTTGKASAANGLANVNTDEVIQRLENIIRTGIEPRITGIQSRAIEGFAHGPVILIRVPRSWASPHMVSFKASPRFFTRISVGKAPLDLSEIRAAFVLSETLPEKIRDLRADRMSKILAGETPVPLISQPTTVLHVVPVDAFHNRLQVDLAAFSSRRFELPTISYGGTNGRLNVDGFVAFSYEQSPDNQQIDYTQLFRNGVIEAVDASMIPAVESNDRFISGVAFERDIVKATAQYFSTYRHLEIRGPVIAMLSLLRVRGYHIGINPQQRIFHRRNLNFDRDYVFLPDVVIEDLSAPVELSLRPLFDLLWQSCGFPKSPNYDEAGNWTVRSG